MIPLKSGPRSSSNSSSPPAQQLETGLMTRTQIVAVLLAGAVCAQGPARPPPGMRFQRRALARPLQTGVSRWRSHAAVPREVFE